MGSVNILQGMKKPKGRMPQHCLARPGMQMESGEKGVCPQQKAAVPQKAQPAPSPRNPRLPKALPGAREEHHGAHQAPRSQQQPGVKPVRPQSP